MMIVGRLLQRLCWISDLDCVNLHVNHHHHCGCLVCHLHQGEHLSGKPGNVREFDSCQGNVRDFCRAMLCISAAYAVVRCLCVCHVHELCQNE